MPIMRYHRTSVLLCLPHHLYGLCSSTQSFDDVKMKTSSPLERLAGLLKIRQQLLANPLDTRVLTQQLLRGQDSDQHGAS